MEYSLLIEAIKRDFPKISESTDTAWIKPPAVRVIDCVLSLNRRYDGFVVPRITKFQEKYPAIVTINQLLELIHEYISENEFVQEELNYRDPKRARILLEVINFLITVSNTNDIELEQKNLHTWAINSNPKDYKKTNIKGFGIAGFQYLRMLFGANTTKPDVHIKRYVSQNIGQLVTEIQAIEILEKVAEETGISVRNLDTSIWEASTRK